MLSIKELIKAQAHSRVHTQKHIDTYNTHILTRTHACTHTIHNIYTYVIPCGGPLSVLTEVIIRAKNITKFA